MKAEVLDRFIGRRVEIRLKNGERLTGILKKDGINKKRYKIVRQIESEVVFADFSVVGLGVKKRTKEEFEKIHNCKDCEQYFADFGAGTEDCHWLPTEDEEIRPCERIK